MAYALGQLEKHSDSVLLNHSQCWYWEAQVRDAQYLPVTEVSARMTRFIGSICSNKSYYGCAMLGQVRRSI